jgi:hypothetical protein
MRRYSFLLDDPESWIRLSVVALTLAYRDPNTARDLIAKTGEIDAIGAYHPARLVAGIEVRAAHAQRLLRRYARPLMQRLRTAEREASYAERINFAWPLRWPEQMTADSDGCQRSVRTYVLKKLGHRTSAGWFGSEENAQHTNARNVL